MQLTAQTKQGPVQGRECGEIAFAGIPYASPPIDGLRFAPPTPPVKDQQFLMRNNLVQHLLNSGDGLTTLMKSIGMKTA